jgi:hypothetical protein
MDFDNKGSKHKILRFVVLSAHATTCIRINQENAMHLHSRKCLRELRKEASSTMIGKLRGNREFLALQHRLWKPPCQKNCSLMFTTMELLEQKLWWQSFV